MSWSIVILATTILGLSIALLRSLREIRCLRVLGMASRLTVARQLMDCIGEARDETRTVDVDRLDEVLAQELDGFLSSTGEIAPRWYDDWVSRKVAKRIRDYVSGRLLTDVREYLSRRSTESCVPLGAIESALAESHSCRRRDED